MDFFVFIAIVMLFCIVIDTFTHQGQYFREAFILWFLCILIFISGFRSGGVDYDGYKFIYESVPDISKFFGSYDLLSSIHGEFCFLLLNSLVKFIFDDFYVVLLVMAILSCGLLVNISRTYSCLPLLSIYIYYTRFFIDRDIAQIRSGLAALIVVYGMKYIIKKDFLKYFCVILCATLFHKVAIIAGVLYFIRDRYLSAKYITILLLLSYFIGVLLPFDEYIIPILMMTDLDFFNNYIGSSYADELGVFYIVMIYQLSVIGVCMLIGVGRNNNYERIIYNMYICSTMWLMIFSKLGIFAGRVATIFTTVEMFLIPYIIYSLSNKYTRCICLIIAVAIYLFMMILKVDSQSVTYDNFIFHVF